MSNQISIRPDLFQILADEARQSACTIEDLVNEAIEVLLLERQAIAAYEEWKQDPSTARPWEEVLAELIEEGLLDDPDDEVSKPPDTILGLAASVHDGL